MTRLARQDRRGVALLYAIAVFAMLSVLVTDISYQARVRFLMGQHQRDQVAAYWLANSGVGMYRLILKGNQQIAKNSMFKSLMETMGIPPNDALWTMLPFINTGLLRMIFTSSGPNAEEEIAAAAAAGEVSEEAREETTNTSSRFGEKDFLDFSGDFSADVRGENCRINVNMLSSMQTGDAIVASPVGQLMVGLMQSEEDQTWLRERNLLPEDLVNNLRDWVDADNIVASGKGGYEDDFYNRQQPPYVAKNAPFDTLEEIREVEGWQDDVYARYADKFTIWGNDKININCADPKVIAAMLKAYMRPAPTDTTIELILEQLAAYRQVTAFQKGKDFCSWAQSQQGGNQLPTELCSRLSTKTTHYTVTSTGQVGGAAVKITTVLDYTSSDDGKVVYWRVD